MVNLIALKYFVPIRFENFICGTFNSTKTTYTNEKTPFVVLSTALRLLLPMEKIPPWYF